MHLLSHAREVSIRHLVRALTLRLSQCRNVALRRCEQADGVAAEVLQQYERHLALAEVAVGVLDAVEGGDALGRGVR